MSIVLIISRTQMGGINVCIGGYDIEKRKNIRLLSANGSNQQNSIPFQIGQIWQINYSAKRNLQPPHLEDVLLGSFELLGYILDTQLFTFIANNCPVTSGSPRFLFNDSLHAAPYKAAYTDNNQVPDHSVCFWKTDQDIQLIKRYDKESYLYQDTTDNLAIYFSYVGLQPTISTIPIGAIVRLSLTRPWVNNPNSEGKDRCYLQISGWYLCNPESASFEDHTLTAADLWDPI